MQLLVIVYARMQHILGVAVFPPWPEYSVVSVYNISIPRNYSGESVAELLICDVMPHNKHICDPAPQRARERK
jgi:hypothetical protein